MMNFSFIVPVYNCIATLSACVEAVCAVDLTDWELLFIDDGSTDGSGGECDRLAGQYPQVRVLHQENGGVSAARNRGIQEARGKWLLFMDADDDLESEKLGAVLKAPAALAGDMVCFGMAFEFYRKGVCYRRDPLYYPREGLLTRAQWSGDLETLFLCNSLSTVCNKAYRRDFLQANGLRFREDMFLYEDLEFVLRCLHHCGSIYNVPQALYRYRQSEDEGNAGRRVQKISALSAWIVPVEQAMDALADTVPEQQRKCIVLRLYLILAREKVAVSDLAGVRQLCEDYRKWSRGRQVPVVEPSFQSQLQAGRAGAILLHHKKTALRHQIAIRVKSLLR